MRVRLRSAIKLVYSARVVEDADPYGAPRNQDVGRGPVPRRCPAGDRGGPQVAALRWVRCGFAGVRHLDLVCSARADDIRPCDGAVRGGGNTGYPELSCLDAVIAQR